MTTQLLPRLFPSNEICPAVWLDDLVKLAKEERSKYRLYFGHYNNYLRHFVDIPFRKLTLLRHPFERAISNYRYILASEAHPLHDALVSVGSFAAYLDEREVFCPNSLTLALGTEVDPDEVLARARRHEDGTSLHQLFDEATFGAPARASHAEAAKRVLDDCVFVGLQEEMEKSSRLLFDHFGQEFDGHLTRSNETKYDPLTLDDLGPEILEKLTETHRHDLEVYAYGKTLFARKWRTFLAGRGQRPQPARA